MQLMTHISTNIHVALPEAEAGANFAKDLATAATSSSTSSSQASLTARSKSPIDFFRRCDDDVTGRVTPAEVAEMLGYVGRA
jgi:hypothetical protein